VEQVLYRRQIANLPYFKKGMKAYFQAKKLDPSASLAEYREYLAGYEQLNRIFHEKGLLDPNALL
jgi:hypothetical protein